MRAEISAELVKMEKYFEMKDVFDEETVFFIIEAATAAVTSSIFFFFFFFLSFFSNYYSQFLFLLQYCKSKR